MSDEALVEQVAAAIDRSEYVRDWPPDEQDYFRNGEWGSFTERTEELRRMRARKVIAMVREQGT